MSILSHYVRTVNIKLCCYIKWVDYVIALKFIKSVASSEYFDDQMLLEYLK